VIASITLGTSLSASLSSIQSTAASLRMSWDKMERVGTTLLVRRAGQNAGFDLSLRVR
jgi:hypothetical protein